MSRVEDWMKSQIDRQRVAGLAVIVQHRGKTAFARSMGLADIERGRPMGEDTIVRLYSMTKTLTSIGILMLYEEGLLQLDDPAHRWLPSFRDQRVLTGGMLGQWQTEPVTRSVTIRDLLTHTSGLTYAMHGADAVDAMYRAQGIDHWSERDDLATVVDRLGAIPLVAHPGSRFTYSFSTDVLGRLIEVIGGRPLDAFLDERVCRPLGLHDTAFVVPDGKIDRFAVLYGRGDDGALVRLDDPETSKWRRRRKLLSGGGGMVSTARDFLKIVRLLAAKGAVDGVRLLGRKTVELMTMNHLPGDIASMGPSVFTGSPMTGMGYGLGVLVTLDPARTQILGSPGEFSWNGNGSTSFWVDPAEDMAVLLMTQLFSASTYPFRRELRVATYQAIAT